MKDDGGVMSFIAPMAPSASPSAGYEKYILDTDGNVMIMIRGGMILHPPPAQIFPYRLCHHDIPTNPDHDDSEINTFCILVERSSGAASSKKPCE
jgi:hypothetical protein